MYRVAPGFCQFNLDTRSPPRTQTSTWNSSHAVCVDPVDPFLFQRCVLIVSKMFVLAPCRLPNLLGKRALNRQNRGRLLQATCSITCALTSIDEKLLLLKVSFWSLLHDVLGQFGIFQPNVRNINSAAIPCLLTPPQTARSCAASQWASRTDHNSVSPGRLSCDCETNTLQLVADQMVDTCQQAQMSSGDKAEWSVRAKRTLLLQCRRF